MKIDPRLMQQLLQLQFRGNVDLFPPRTQTDDTGFAALLETIVEQTSLHVHTAQSADRSRPVSAAPAFAAAPSAHRIFRRSEFDPLIGEAAARYAVDPALIRAVIHTESAFNPYAVSRAGAKGLMQLMDSTGRELGVTDPFDPWQNIEAGTRYLAGLLAKYGGNESVALAAYNAGPGRVDRLGIRNDEDYAAKRHLLPAETQRYVETVLQRKREYRHASVSAVPLNGANGMFGRISYAE